MTKTPALPECQAFSHLLIFSFCYFHLRRSSIFTLGRLGPDTDTDPEVEIESLIADGAQRIIILATIQNIQLLYVRTTVL